MARVALLGKDEAHPEMRDMFKRMEDNGNEILNIYRAVAHSPKIGRDFLRLGNAILFKGELSPVLRELAILRIASLTGASYEWAQHVIIALHVGVKQEQVDAVPNWAQSTEFNENERAVLLFTDEVTQKIRASNESFSKIRSALSEQAAVELTITIGYYGMVSRVLETLQVELEEGREESI